MDIYCVLLSETGPLLLDNISCVTHVVLVEVALSYPLAIGMITRTKMRQSDLLEHFSLVVK